MLGKKTVRGQNHHQFTGDPFQFFEKLRPFILHQVFDDIESYDGFKLIICEQSTDLFCPSFKNSIMRPIFDSFQYVRPPTFHPD